MALRILSGMIFVPNGGIPTGSVTIGFNPFALTARSNPAFELRKEREIGPTGRYRAPPAIIVAARQFDIVTGAGGIDFRSIISDDSDRDQITISWAAAGGSAGRVDQEEIPFMVVGEVPDRGATVTIPRPPGVTRPDDDIPSDLNFGSGGRSRQSRRRPAKRTRKTGKKRRR